MNNDFAEIFPNMVTNNGRRILEEHLISTPNYGNSNSNIDKLLTRNMD